MTLDRQQAKPQAVSTATVPKSREGIEKILLEWGVTGISWIDNFEKSQSVLRFAWKKDDKYIVARFLLQMKTDDELYEMSVDKRSARSKVSEKKFKRLQHDRGKVEHRLLHMWLKDSMNAITHGVISAEQLFFAWIEDGEGVTLYEKIEPILGQLPSTQIPLAIKESEEEDADRT